MQTFQTFYVESKSLDEFLDLLFTKDYGSKTKANKIAKKAKFPFLGEGNEAKIWKLGKNKALRIGDYDNSVRCWADYARLVMNKKNEHYPKIFRLKTFNRYLVAEMELLDSFSSKNGFENLDDIVVYGFLITYRYELGMKFKIDGFDPRPLEIFSKKFSIDLVQKKLKFSEKEAELLMVGKYETDKYMQKFRSHPFIRAMKSILRLKGCHIDMHIGNLMWRGKTLILNDPLF